MNRQPDSSDFDADPEGPDPGALFRELRGGPLPDGFWIGFDTRLRARLDERRIDWASFVRAPRILTVTAPLAMILALGITLLTLAPGRFGREGAGNGARIGAMPSPFALPGPRTAPPAALPDGARGAGLAGSPRSMVAEPSARPELEEVTSPGARVYQFVIGAPGDETPIYLVVDESINI